MTIMKETIEYKGFEIEIIRGDYAENPWESWDSEPPLIANSPDRWRKNSTDYSKGDIWRHITGWFTENRIRRHMSSLKRVFSVGLSNWTYELNQGQTFTEIIQDKLDDVSNDDFDILEQLCGIAKIPCLKTYSHGYSQGDYVKLFFCWTPEFEKTTGCDIKNAQEIFESGKKLFVSWAWGDVYGYNIEEIGDSCWGFYGDDHKESGLLGMAYNVIDCYLDRKEKERVKKLKTMIRNRVPYQYRTFI